MLSRQDEEAKEKAGGSGFYLFGTHGQEVGHAKLRERGIDLIAADNPGSFIDDTPTAKLVRQVLGAISESDKAMTVAKLRGARERKRREAGKCEGRKSHAERNPELVARAKRLHRQKPKGGRMSLRAISSWRSKAS
jgi:DNA invertase Pin-like site-specific DNA recombinase